MLDTLSDVYLLSAELVPQFEVTIARICCCAMQT